MYLLGNFFLILAFLIFLSLVNLLYFVKMPGGDAGMSYAWALLYSFFGFLVCIFIIASVIGLKGGFAWAANTGGGRFFRVTLGVLFAVVGTGICALFGDEPGPLSGLLRMVGRILPLTILPILLIGSGLFLNAHVFDALPKQLPQWLSILAASLGLVGVGLGALSMVGASLANSASAARESKNREDQNHQRMLQEIADCDIEKNMVFILVHSDGNQDPEVRTAAVAKIRSRQDWQQELVRLLQTDWAPQAFNFLASNEVDDKTLFPEAVQKGLFVQAKLIRESIGRSTHSSHFYPDLFMWEVERALRTADRFLDLGTDFRPAVAEMLAALDEPTDVEKTELRCRKKLQNWLKDHPSR